MNKNLNEMCNWMRYKIIEMAHNAGKKGAHIGSALSCVEIMACLYGKIMNVTPESCKTFKHDVFIPSKAHCVLSYYTALAYMGFIQEAMLDDFGNNESVLSGHPIMNKEIGIEFSGGSLGMGFSQSVGVALGMKRHNINNRVYVLLGDGECDEGAVWEAAQSAVHFELDNLVVVIDVNKIQYDGFTKDIMGHRSLKDKFHAFGFFCIEVDGHDIKALLAAFDKAMMNRVKQPTIILADTIKGKGISFMENNKHWHHAVLSDTDYSLAMKELGVNDGNK